MRSSLLAFSGVQRSGISWEPSPEVGDLTTAVGVDGQLPATTFRHCANYAVAY